MALSDYEKQILEQMEKQLRAEDPELGSAFDATTDSFPAPSHNETPPSSQPRFYSSPRLWAAAFVSILVGITLLLTGVTMFRSYAVLGVILAVVGFLAMLFAVTLPFNKKAATRLKAYRGGDTGSPSARQSQQQSFMQRQEDKWDRRKDRGN